jgi:hypothetical protein
LSKSNRDPIQWLSNSFNDFASKVDHPWQRCFTTWLGLLLKTASLPIGMGGDAIRAVSLGALFAMASSIFFRDTSIIINLHNPSNVHALMIFPR